MVEDSDTRIYEFEVNHRDAGYELGIPWRNWMELVREDFTSFEVIRGTFKTDRETFEERLREEFVEIKDDEDPEPVAEGPRFRIDNPPKQWTEDPANAADFLVPLNTLLARMGLYVLIEEELENLDELINETQYKATVVRQSAFIEDFLKFHTQLSLQSQKGATLSSKEMNLIEQMGNKDRIRFAHLLGAIDEDEHSLLQDMASWRNRIAHTSWTDFDSQDESQIESIAKQVRGFLKDQIEQAEDFFEDVDDPESTEEFIGFDALDIDLQLLQLSILDVIFEKGGSTTLSEIQDILPEDNDEIESRCIQMVGVGYLEKSGNEFRITEFGREFYEEESF